jgi:hypothetical protein
VTAPPKRRWFRFGLRTMFVVIALIALPFATGPFLIEVGSVIKMGKTISVYEPNFAFLAVVLIEVVASTFWAGWWRPRRSQEP